MRKISVFNFVSVDGFFAGRDGEIDWFKSMANDEEFDRDTHRASASEGVLIFGRKTYQMMKSFWPTPEAMESDPAMAKSVDEREKIVFSNTLKGDQEGPHWKKVTVIPEMTEQIVSEIKNRKGLDLMILGSGSIVSQLTRFRLIDEYQLVVVPVVLGSGQSMFSELERIDMRLVDSKTYKNGVVWLTYRPVLN